MEHLIVRQHNPIFTPHDLQFIRMIAEGHSNKEIAEAMNVTPGTCKVYLARFYKQFGFTWGNPRVRVANWYWTWKQCQQNTAMDRSSLNGRQDASTTANVPNEIRDENERHSA